MNNNQLNQVENLKKRGIIMALMLVICAAPISTGAEFYVSPNGKQKGTGTKEDPFDIVAALSGRESVQPGDTVWLRGGIYTLPANPKSGKSLLNAG